MHSIGQMGIPLSKRSQSSTSNKGKAKKDENDDSSSNLDVMDEYTEVFRTKSYTEIASKVKGQLMNDFRIGRLSSTSSSTSQPFYVHQSDSLIEPSQQTVIDMAQNSAIRSLLMDFFNSSLDTFHLCELLLQGAHRTSSDYCYIQRAIKIANANDDNHPFKEASIADNLSSFASLGNPLSIISQQQFANIHERLSILLHQLIAKHKKIKRKVKFATICSNAFGCGSKASSSVFGAAFFLLAVHSIAGTVGKPKVLPPSSFGVSRKTRSSASQLKLICGQLDLAARGVYILINQLDTMHCLVARLDNEVQHNKAIASMCMRTYKRGHEVSREAMKELMTHEDRFLEQLDELQKHLCFCVLTINKSRRFVIEH